jgi:succinate dehydrogenase / fumarate reductase cytochrome b subunit
MSLTGAFLVLFVTFHALMNGVALLWPAAYNQVCMFLGANWYALIGTVILAAGCILHIVFATLLTLQNRKARGHERYAVTARQSSVEWSSKNMFVLGLVVICFFIVHLIQFWSKMQLAEIMGTEVIDCATGETVPAAAGTWFLAIAFRCPFTLPIYLIGFIALWFHLTHGVWSMLQTLGWNNKLWMQRVKCIANAWSTIVIALFVAEAIVFTIQANRGVYTNCPVLQQQYQEMLAEQNDDACCQEATAGCPFEKQACGEGECAGCPKAKADCPKTTDCCEQAAAESENEVPNE